ncbi:hypothetical protein H4R34_002406 [Dimargaris verticillata]|uniref:Pentacotripeptide-repeat region of PRORP domain-containing protein n=1 Tax=Dimargaris verticillata TaxID=2761393 RepID=A0A9W8B1V3_9FUNG|nr:hypothetical protein H4R34_002406 [Dimargaris verticillata]
MRVTATCSVRQALIQRRPAQPGHETNALSSALRMRLAQAVQEKQATAAWLTYRLCRQQDTLAKLDNQLYTQLVQLLLPPPTNDARYTPELATLEPPGAAPAALTPLGVTAQDWFNHLSQSPTWQQLKVDGASAEVLLLALCHSRQTTAAVNTFRHIERNRIILGAYSLYVFLEYLYHHQAFQELEQALAYASQRGNQESRPASKIWAWLTTELLASSIPLVGSKLPFANALLAVSRSQKLDIRCRQLLRLAARLAPVLPFAHLQTWVGLALQAGADAELDSLVVSILQCPGALQPALIDQMLTVYMTRRQFDQILALYDHTRAHASSLPPSILAHFLAGLVHLPHSEPAQLLLQELRGWYAQLTPFDYSRLVTEACHADRANLATHFLTAMLSHKYAVSARLRKVIFRQLHATLSPTLASWLTHAFMQRRIQPDLDQLALLLHCQPTPGDPAVMQTLLLLIARHRQRLALDQANMVLAALAHHPLVTGSLALCTFLTGPECALRFNSKALAGLVHIALHAKDTTLTTQVGAKVLASTASLDRSIQSQLLRAYLEVGQLDAAFGFFCRLLVSHTLWEVAAVQFLFRRLVEAHRFVDALIVLRTAHKPLSAHLPEMSQALAQACFDHRQYQLMDKLHQMMLDYHIEVTPGLYTLLVKQLTSQGRPEEAYQLYCRCAEENVILDAECLVHLIDYLARSGQVDDVVPVMDCLVANYHQIPNQYYMRLLQAFHQARFGPGIRRLNVILHKAYAPSQFTATIYEALFNALLAVGDRGSLVKLWQKLRDAPVRPTPKTITLLLQACRELNIADVEGVLQYKEQWALPFCLADCHALIALYSHQDQAANALAVLTNVMPAAQLLPTARTINLVLGACNQTNDVALCAELGRFCQLVGNPVLQWFQDGAQKCTQLQP